MASIDNTPRPAYVWDKTNSKWIEISGRANTAQDYIWSGTHTFNNPVLIKNRFNYFATIQDRVNAFAGTTIQHGTLSFLVQDGSGVVNRLEYYDSVTGTWIQVAPSKEQTVEIRDTATVSYDLTTSDAFKVIQFSNSATTTFNLISSPNIRIGTSITVNRNASTPLNIVAASGVTLQLVSGTSYVLGKSASAILIKVALDAWIMVGIGSGLPTGGTTGQALTKIDNTDYNTQWTSIVPAAGGTFTGAVTFNGVTTVSDSGNFRIGTRKVIVSSAQPASGNNGDIWIQIP